MVQEGTKLAGSLAAVHSIGNRPGGGGGGNGGGGIKSAPPSAPIYGRITGCCGTPPSVHFYRDGQKCCTDGEIVDDRAPCSSEFN